MSEGINGVTPNPEAKMKSIHDKSFNTDMLTGNKRHWCPDWDFAAIDDSMPEFDCCTCNLKGFD